MPVKRKKAKGGGLKGLRQRVEAANRVEVVAGIVGPNASKVHGDSGFTMAALGTAHEFGFSTDTTTVPARSFVRAPVRSNQARIQQALAKAGRKVMEGGDPARELGRVGLLAEGIMKKAMSDGIPPPLAESTIARRKSNSTKPLVDTGQLRGAITSVVRRKGGG